MNALTETQWEDRLQEIDQIAVNNIKHGKKKYYLFLDFDGVINIWHVKNPQSIKDNDSQFADIPSIKRLSDLCLKYNLYIIISSSWRFAGAAYCANYLKRCGLKKGCKVAGITKQDFEERQMHITDYLLEHPDYTGFMVLDDLYLPHLDKNLVKCETLEGFDKQKQHQAYMKMKQMEVRSSALRSYHE